MSKGQLSRRWYLDSDLNEGKGGATQAWGEAPGDADGDRSELVSGNPQEEVWGGGSGEGMMGKGWERSGKRGGRGQRAGPLKSVKKRLC